MRCTGKQRFIASTHQFRSLRKTIINKNPQSFVNTTPIRKQAEQLASHAYSLPSARQNHKVLRQTIWRQNFRRRHGLHHCAQLYATTRTNLYVSARIYLSDIRMCSTPWWQVRARDNIQLRIHHYRFRFANNQTTRCKIDNSEQLTLIATTASAYKWEASHTVDDGRRQATHSSDALHQHAPIDKNIIIDTCYNLLPFYLRSRPSPHGSALYTNLRNVNIHTRTHLRRKQ